MYDFLRRLFALDTSARVEAAGNRVATAAAAYTRQRLALPTDLVTLPAVVDDTEVPPAIVKRGVVSNGKAKAAVK